MRPFLLVSAILCLCATTSVAMALQAGDTMQNWKNASDKERADLLATILGTQAESAKVTRCMNETAVVPGHSTITIAEVAKACAKAGDDGQPV